MNVKVAGKMNGHISTNRRFFASNVTATQDGVKCGLDLYVCIEDTGDGSAMFSLCTTKQRVQLFEVAHRGWLDYTGDGEVYGGKFYLDGHLNVFGGVEVSFTDITVDDDGVVTGKIAVVPKHYPAWSGEVSLRIGSYRKPKEMKPWR